jgi:hypothetical protein
MRVYGVVRMALRAMRLPHAPTGTRSILAVGHRLKVVRVNASPVLAGLIIEATQVSVMTDVV